MYLAYKLGGLTQAEIATRFGITHFGLSKAIAATWYRRGQSGKSSASAGRSQHA